MALLIQFGYSNLAFHFELADPARNIRSGCDTEFAREASTWACVSELQNAGEASSAAITLSSGVP
ncbi:hypothetical protein [Sphingomonas sp. CCH5-D11]|uniref:hypothetical protein n=1 Tax=Sphingomonas sp. CCH5-D11 TaxID=1768786 RepID=UPI00082C5136|nr:hypothetical protein [Sphingomonas sp. CCH5-D11]